MRKWILGALFVSLPCVAMAEDKVNSKKEREAKFDQYFQMMDTDKSGKISKAEAQANDPTLLEHFDQMDANHDGQLTRAEIRNALASAEKRQRQFVQNLAKADADKNGKLSREEAKALPNLSANFDEIDINHDGELVMQEITNYLRGKGNTAPAAKK